MLKPDEREAALKRSKFRSRFRLNDRDLRYLEKAGRDKVRSHARDFILTRLAAALPEKDGRQTPFKGHPVFKAQHATATCCRGCLGKWYGIEKGRPLSAGEVKMIVDEIMKWIETQAVAGHRGQHRGHFPAVQASFLPELKFQRPVPVGNGPKGV